MQGTPLHKKPEQDCLVEAVGQARHTDPLHKHLDPVLQGELLLREEVVESVQEAQSQILR